MARAVSLLKPDLRDLVVHGRLEEVAEIAVHSRRTLGKLVALTYDAEPAVAWGAVDAMGAAAARVADDDADFVRHHLRRLHWLLQEEAGGICWHAPEAMAEIVARRPVPFADYIPIVVNLILETAQEDLEHFRAGMLWAVGRLGALAADAAGEVLPAVVEALRHGDPQVRGMAVWCLERLGAYDEIARRPELLEDEGACTLWADGALRAVTVGQLAGETKEAGAGLH